MKTLTQIYRILRAVVLAVPMLVGVLILTCVGVISSDYKPFRMYSEMALYVLWPYNDPEYQSDKDLTFL